MCQLFHALFHSCSSLFLSLTHIISTSLFIDYRISLISACWATTICCNSLTSLGNWACSFSCARRSFSFRISPNILYSYRLPNGREPISLSVAEKSLRNDILRIRWVSKLFPRSAVVYHKSKSRLYWWPAFDSSIRALWLGPSGFSGLTSGEISTKVS